MSRMPLPRSLGPLALTLLLAALPACSRKLARPDPARPDTPAGGADTGWYEVQADEGFFFTMPAAPEVQRQQVPTAAGPLPLVLYLHTDEEKGAAFNVTTARYPEGFMDARSPAEVLTGARDGAVDNISGELVEQRDVQLFVPDGSVAPGLEIVIDTPEGLIYRSRIFVVGPRLIQLSYVASEAAGTETEYRHFVESFVLTAVEGAEAPAAK